MIRQLMYLMLPLLIYAFSGCTSSTSNREPELSTDVVFNPNSADNTVTHGDLPVITFEETQHDFGRILEGETVSYEFKFTNTGKSDLLLAEVNSSCGCTVPSYTKAPIRPGEKGTIKVTFNSVGRRGFQTKDVVVVANTQPNAMALRIKAQVVNPAGENN